MQIPLEWHPREIPLKPVAVCVQGEPARRMARRLLALDAEALAGLQGVSGAGVLVLLAEADLLPWVDGALYLGREPAAPGLLLPTMLLPSAPLPLLERALRLHLPELTSPLALVPGMQTALALHAAAPLIHEALQRWLEANP